MHRFIIMLANKKLKPSKSLKAMQLYIIPKISTIVFFGGGGEGIQLFINKIAKSNERLYVKLKAKSSKAINDPYW